MSEAKGGNGINPEWVKTDNPDNWDAKVTALYEQKVSNKVSELQPGPRNTLNVEVNPHFCLDCCGDKQWTIQPSNGAASMSGSLPPRKTKYDVELRDPATDTAMKLKVDRGCCRNEYHLEDTEGNLVARTKDQTIGQKIKNTLIGQFFGYNIVEGLDAHGAARYVIKVCGMCSSGCNFKCISGCALCLMDIDCPGCEMYCPTFCKVPCKAQCKKCNLDGKCGCDMDLCKLECKKGCMLQCDMLPQCCSGPCKDVCCEKKPCSVCLPGCKAGCKAECDKCKSCCEKCKICCKNKDCNCTCITKPFHHEVHLLRPWETKCENWITKIEWNGEVNALGLVLPGYTMTIHFPDDADIVDRAALVSLGFYCDQHMLGKLMHCCPTPANVKK